MSFDANKEGHRLRTTRLALGLSEVEAAADFGVSLRTYRQYEARGLPQKRWQRREDEFNDIRWGEAAALGPHLTLRTKGKVTILPSESVECRNGRIAGAIRLALPKNTRDALAILYRVKRSVELLQIEELARVRKEKSNVMLFAMATARRAAQH